MLRRLPPWKFPAKPPAHENTVHRLDNGRRGAVCLVERSKIIGIAVFLAAEDAEAALGETGTLFRAAVSVLRIFTGSFTPPGALLSVSAMIKILFEKQKLFFYDGKYSIQTGEGK